MGMSKKDFIALADALRPVVGSMRDNEDGDAQADMVEGAIADFCAASNPAFMRDRWLGYLRGECGASGGKVKASSVERWPGGGPVLKGDR